MELLCFVRKVIVLVWLLHVGFHISGASAELSINGHSRPELQPYYVISESSFVGHPHPRKKNLLLSAWNAYKNEAIERPLITKMYSAGIMSGVGDVLSQWIQWFKACHDHTAAVRAIGEQFFPPEAFPAFRINLPRVLVFFLAGALYMGPYLNTWFNMLDKSWCRLAEGRNLSDTKRAVYMTALDQSISAPVSNLGFMAVFTFLNMLIMDGSLATIGDVLVKIKTSFMPTLAMNFRFWPAVQFVNFFAVPLEMRFFVSSLATIVWNALLSAVVNQ